MYWCVSSDEGTKAMANDMGFVIPFKNAQESPNLFVKVDNALTAEGKTPVAWCFSTMPSENWKNGVGSALTACSRHWRLERCCDRLCGWLEDRSCPECRLI